MVSVVYRSADHTVAILCLLVQQQLYVGCTLRVFMMKSKSMSDGRAAVDMIIWLNINTFYKCALSETAWPIGIVKTPTQTQLNSTSI